MTRIVTTTCPYGDLDQHLNDTANCEDPHCVFIGKPIPKEHRRRRPLMRNLRGARSVLAAIQESHE